jgi:sulfur carrier protein
MLNASESAAVRESVGYVAHGNQPPSQAPEDSELEMPEDRRVSTSQSESRIELGLFVNGEPQMLKPPCTVADLLANLGMGGRRVAVAVNRTVVVRSRYGDAALADGDRIEILEAVGGG